MGYYTNLWNKQKNTGTYKTRDNGYVTGTKKASGANAVSAASDDLGAGKATTTTTKSSSSKSSKSSGSKSSAAANAYAALLNSQAKTTPNLTYKAPTVTAAPTVKPVKTMQTVASDIATNAYKQRMAAAQANQSYAYDDGYDASKNPSTGKTKSGLNTSIFELFGGSVPAGKQADYSGLEAAKTYEPKEQAWRDAPLSSLIGTATPASATGAPVATAEVEQRVPTSTGASYTFGGAMLPSVDGSQEAANSYNRYMTRDGKLLDTAGFNAMVDAQKQQIADQKAADKEAAEAAAYQAYLNELAEIERQRLLEERMEQEEAESELADAIQAIIDAQNAQAAANLQMLQNQSGVLNQQYDNNAANLYAQYRRSGLMMPELMAGTATGIADSFALQNDLALQNNLAANELDRASAQNELSAQANEIQANADLQAAQTAADWAKMAYQQRLANQSSGTKTTTSSNDDKETTTVSDVKEYLQLQLGMGNNMTKANIERVLKEMYAAGAISKELAKGVAQEYGFTLYF